MTDMLSWIQSFSTVDKLLLRTGFLFDGERPDSHFKTETPSKCVYFYERLFQPKNSVKLR
jgi:hypothetical protein